MRIRSALLTLVLASAPAFAADPPCMQMNRLFSWHEIDKHSILLEDVGHKKFKVTYSGFCGNLQFVLSIGVKSNSASRLACLAHGDMLLTRVSGASFQCMVMDVAPYETPPAPK